MNILIFLILSKSPPLKATHRLNADDTLRIDVQSEATLHNEYSRHNGDHKTANSRSNTRFNILVIPLTHL